MGRAQHRSADPDRDDPDVLDRAIGQQALEIVLRQGEGDAEKRRRRRPTAITIQPAAAGTGSHPPKRISP